MHASYAPIGEYQQAVMVLLTTKTIQTDSTFRAKTPRRELVWGVEEICSE
jgi:hypothetical protein